MGRILKLLGIVFAAILLLIFGATLLVGMLVDPNDYKDQITAAVTEATGRELTLNGDLDLEVFPRLRIAVGAAELSNAAGFGDLPFAQIEGARLQLGLFPLLFRRIEIGEARLLGLRLNLARNAGGAGNWQLGDTSAALPANSADETELDEADSGADFELDVGAVQIADAQVSWSDATTGADWLLTNFNFDASDFGPGTTFPVSLGFGLAGEEIEVTVAANMQATLSLADNRYRLDELEVEIAGQSDSWPGGQGQAALRFESFIADIENETLNLNGLRLELLGLNISGTLTGEQFLSDLSLSGAVEIAEFDPHDILDAFGAAIETADPDVLRRASARADYFYTGDQTGLRDMTLSLDDSELVGSLGMQGETLRFSLLVDAINIDRYLPPAAETETEPDEGSLDEVDLPLDVLRDLRASGDLQLREAQFTGLQLSDASFDVDITPGRLRLSPRASLYGGSIEGEIGVDVQGDTARFTLLQELQGVDLMALGKDYLDSEMISGTGSISLDLSATGSNLGEMRRQLDGSVAFTLRDGAWEGTDLWYELRRARAVLDGDPSPEREGPPRTPFSIVSASGLVEDAVLDNRDLNATLPFMTVDGGGTVNLLTDEMDFDLVARFVDGPVLQSDPEMAGLTSGELPLAISGTLAAPSVTPDFGALIAARAREEVEERIEEEREEVEDRVRDRVRDRLRGILDR